MMMRRSNSNLRFCDSNSSTPEPQAFRPREWEIIQKFRTPKQVQEFLRSLPYNWEKEGETLRTFRGVVQHWSAHCLEAALRGVGAIVPFQAATELTQRGL